MKLVVQRVSQASVKVDTTIVGQIHQGLLVYLGITHTDTQQTIDFLCEKLLNCRIFSNDEGKFDLSVQDVLGDILVVSQFTLYSNCQKGRRPDFKHAAPADIARRLYEQFLATLSTRYPGKIQSGQFGATMQVSSVNMGPVTLLIDA